MKLTLDELKMEAQSLSSVNVQARISKRLGMFHVKVNETSYFAIEALEAIGALRAMVLSQRVSYGEHQ